MSEAWDKTGRQVYVERKTQGGGITASIRHRCCRNKKEDRGQYGLDRFRQRRPNDTGAVAHHAAREGHPHCVVNGEKIEVEGPTDLVRKDGCPDAQRSITNGCSSNLARRPRLRQHNFFEHLQDLEGFDFIIRFRQGFHLEGDGFSGKAADAVYKNGRIRVFLKARLTIERKGPYTVVLYKALKMKDSWCLATNLENACGADVVQRYGRRFECEECFRDLKDWRYGLGLKHTTIKNDNRRERLLLAFSLAAFLLTLVGIISEEQKCDRLLKANTSKVRTHSLFRQGREIVSGALPTDRETLCLVALKQLIMLALNQWFCHAFS